MVVAWSRPPSLTRIDRAGKHQWRSRNPEWRLLFTALCSGISVNVIPCAQGRSGTGSPRSAKHVAQLDCLPLSITVDFASVSVVLAMVG